MEPLLQQHPLGKRIPDTVHAVCTSLPTLEAVIGYEENRPEILQAMQSGYPRFVSHFYIRQLATYLRQRHGLADRVVLLASRKAIAPLQSFLQSSLKTPIDFNVIETEGYCALSLHQSTSEALQQIHAFLQHTGWGLSSRQAEDSLYQEGQIAQKQPEALFNGDAEARILTFLLDLFDLRAAENSLFLCNSGMNAFYATFQAINTLQRSHGKDLWIQIGWIYVDTHEILNKWRSSQQQAPVSLLNIFDLDTLAAKLAECGPRVAGIICEIPTNPLIQTCDLAHLRTLATQHQIALVIDPTISSPYNIDVLPYADVVVNSLTKYAAHHGDVMAGAIALNPQFSFYSDLKSEIPHHFQPLYERDAQRLAVEIETYTDVMTNVNANTLRLVTFLQKHPSVKKVHWAYARRSRFHYEKIARHSEAPGGCFTIELKRPLATVYDAIRVVKGPSFGTTFTILCPYMYLAHYNLINNQQGRRYLCSQGIDPDLLRISVGIEDPSALEEVFSEVL